MATDRVIGLRIEGPLADRRVVPLELLADKLRAFQHVLFCIGNAVAGGHAGRRWRGVVREACSLQVVRLSHDSPVEVLARLPDTERRFDDLGTRSLENYEGLLAELDARDDVAIARRFPDTSHRARILKSAAALIPDEASEYSLALHWNGRRVRLDASLRDFVYLASQEEPVAVAREVRTIVGKLVRIQTEGPRELGVKWRNRVVRCFYDSENSELVHDLVPNSVVAVRGEVSLDPLGEISQVDTVHDVLTVHVDPLYWLEVVYGDRRFRLRRPIHIVVQVEDGIWSHTYEPLGVYGFGTSRGESLEAFRAEFAERYAFLAEEEDDEVLTLDAREVKAAFRDVVAAVEHVA